jgi:hypothetical protein
MKCCYRCLQQQAAVPPRKSFSARARAQHREQVARCDAHPFARAARDAGLHGHLLRGYLEAVERLDGPLALPE